MYFGSDCLSVCDTDNYLFDPNQHEAGIMCESCFVLHNFICGQSSGRNRTGAVFSGVSIKNSKEYQNERPMPSKICISRFISPKRETFFFGIFFRIAARDADECDVAFAVKGIYVDKGSFSGDGD